MEHGLQTHTVPTASEQRALVARRMNFSGAEEFDRTLKVHTSSVTRAFARVFKGLDADTALPLQPSGGVSTLSQTNLITGMEHTDEANLVAAHAAAATFAPHVLSANGEGESLDSKELGRLLYEVARSALNPHRALSIASRIALSLDKLDERITISESNLVALVRLCGSSEFFGEMVAGAPSLIASLRTQSAKHQRRDYQSILRASVNPEKTFTAELSALRRAWAPLLLDIGLRDAEGDISIFDANRSQAELAVASINVAHVIARREIVRRYGKLNSASRIAILGLGRLASGGVDYGSDLDIIIIYDSFADSPVPTLTLDEAYARLGELMISALSSVTREGYLYRVDLRLRPDGKNGSLSQVRKGFWII